jgi:hypothetical protein
MVEACDGGITRKWSCDGGEGRKGGRGEIRRRDFIYFSNIVEITTWARLVRSPDGCVDHRTRLVSWGEGSVDGQRFFLDEIAEDMRYRSHWKPSR